MKKGPLIAAGIGLTVLGYLAGSPYLTAYQLKQAVDQGDGSKVAAYIDFPSVRANLKQDLGTLIDRQYQQERKQNMAAGLNAVIAKRLLTGMVDMVVTPDNTISMIQGIDPQEAATNPDISRPGEQTEIRQADLAYRGLNRFEIAVTNDDDKTVTLDMQRRFLTWKVVHIHMPNEYMKMSQRL